MSASIRMTDENANLEPDDKPSQRNWYITPSSSSSSAVIHFPTSPLHPSRARQGVPSSIQAGMGTAGESKELDKQGVVTAALAYARELESIV